MKIKTEFLVGFFGTLVVTALGFIGKTVWDGVQIAERTEVKVQMIEKNQDNIRSDVKDLRSDVKELRRELYAVYPVISDVAEAAEIAVGTAVE